MKTYTIRLQETLEYEYEVQAESKEEAHEKFREQLEEGRIDFDHPWIIEQHEFVEEQTPDDEGTIGDY